MGTHKLGYVTSAANPLIGRLRKLLRHNAEYRKLGQVLLEGEHLCRAWAERGGTPAHALVAASAFQEGRFAELLGEAATTTTVLADPLMAEASTLETPAPLAFLVALPAPARLVGDAPSVVIDRLQDAGNVGSILRSAAAFGFTQVIAAKGSAALWSPKVLRAGMGAHFALALFEADDDAALGALTIPLVATSSHAEQPLDAAELPDPCAWLFGNEGGGLRPPLAARASVAVRIPQPGSGESLNVAAAAAICLHESARRRSKGR